MTAITIVSLICVVLFLVLLLVRQFGSGAGTPITYRERRGDARENGRSSVGLADSSYLEVLNLSDIVLDDNETILAACGQRGEIETVILATDKKLFFFTRRFGVSRYHHEIFEYLQLHPIPLGQAVIGEKIRLLEGDRIAEMISPGAESWLDSTEDTIKKINERIRKAREKAIRT